MFRFTNQKNWLFPFLILNTLAVSAITFNTSVLKDTSQTNYTGFTDKNAQRNDKYIKLIADFNGDGLDDMTVYIQNNVHVYLNDSNNSISFYKNYTSPAYLPFNLSQTENSNATYADFNNDGRMDFVSGSDGFIKINIQKDESIRSGIYYDPNFNGHGFSIEELGQKGLYYSVFYTYDEFGSPRWLIGQTNGFELNQDAVINMKQINGYGRLQNHVELSEVNSGNITLNLNQAVNDGTQGGTLSMDVFYPDDAMNDNWKKDNLPIYLFSKPRN